MVLMTTLTDIYEIRSGDRIAQLVPTPGADRARNRIDRADGRG